jgi:signal transduction histidine kinase
MEDTLGTIEPRATETEGLARMIAVAGLQVSQAADDLQQAAERLMAAEEQAREAELRTQTAEEQLAQSATKNAELLEMLQTVREGQTEADERARRAEQRLQIALDRSGLMEEQVQGLESRVKDAEARPMTVIVDDERTALQEAVGAEVRRPLTSLLGLTLALKHADPNSPEGKDMIKQLATNARKLDRLVGEMLDVDKIARGVYTPNLRRIDLEALARRVVEEAPDLASRDIKINAEHVAIEVDPAFTEQMLETLLANAGRRSAPGNTVWLSVSSTQGGVVIAVDDTGPEVPPGLRGSMFALTDEDPASRQKPRGATGLPLLARLAELHGGRAWVEERPGGGASFRVFLPAADAGEGSVGELPAAPIFDDHVDEGEQGLFDQDVSSNGHGTLSSVDEVTDEVAI